MKGKVKGIAVSLMAAAISLPVMVFAHPAVTLLDENGNRIKDMLNSSDKFTAANGSVYMSGPAYSPKKTCGVCHDYQEVTKAYHFREGAGEDGKGVSDTWSDENNDGTQYKYLANAYGHLVSPGQYGAW